MRKLFVIVSLLILSPTTIYAKKEKQKETSKYKCDKSKYCKHMRSCEEAKFLLNVCGMTRLDRGKDGVPCENICSGG